MSVLCYGEVLWDVFPGGAEIGGAVFNLSAHLSRLGETVYFRTAVGGDELGSRAVEKMRGYGIDCRFVEKSPFDTGVCLVSGQDEGTPRYELKEPAAYDDIGAGDGFVQELGRLKPRLLCFGTLSQRRDKNIAGIRRILDAVGFDDVFCDVNVRRPHISREAMLLALENATILKLSREEAAIFSQLGLCAGDGSDLEGLCRELKEKHPNIRFIAVTEDKDGAFIYEGSGGRVIRSRKPRNRLVSAVGAGDSFSAALLHGYLAGKPLEECLAAGIDLSDYVVTRMGAVPE